MTPDTSPTFQPLTNLYEPSAIQQLPDGRFLVVEDEKDHSFSLATLSASGDVSTKSLGPAWFHGGDPIWKEWRLTVRAIFKLSPRFHAMTMTMNKQGAKDPLHNSLRSVAARARAVHCVVFLANSPAIGCKKTPCGPSRSAYHSPARVMQRVPKRLICRRQLASTNHVRVTVISCGLWAHLARVPVTALKQPSFVQMCSPKD
jgi:hypothetical protein